MRIAVIAALPGELKPLMRTGFRRVPATGKHVLKWKGSAGGAECVAVCAGMGAEAARRAFAEAEAEGSIDRVLSVGWAGGLSDGVRGGSSFVASAVVDAQTGERFELAGGGRQLVLVTTARVAGEAEKRRLAASYGGAMVDMESATVVRMAAMRGIPVCCVKAISDEAGAGLPDLNRFIDGDGQMRMGRFVWHVAVRPATWASLVRLGRTSTVAADALAAAVLAILRGTKDFEKINRTGDVSG